MGALFVSCLGASSVLAQNVLDPTFVPPTSEWGVDARIFTQVVQPDGKILVGGYFYSDGTDVRLLRLNADGSRDTSFTPVVTNYDVGRLVLLADGKMLIGEVTTVNDQAVRRLARLNSDGSLDSSFSLPSLTISGSIQGLAVQTDGKLLVAGAHFLDAEDSSIANCMARLNSDGSIDPTFTSPFPLVPASFCPTTLALQADGKILAAGTFPFPNSDSLPFSTLVRLNPDGSLDANLTTSALSLTVSTLYPLPDGRLLAAGINENPLESRVFRLNADGERDASFDVSLTAVDGSSVGSVFNLFAQPNGKIFVAGRFGFINGEPHRHIGRLNPDGTLDSTFDSQGAAVDTGQVTSLAIQRDGRILVGGDFTQIDLASRPKLARLLIPDAVDDHLEFGTTHADVRWRRNGAGPELRQVRFASSIDGQAWVPLGLAQWNEGAWELGGLSLPAGPIWLKASGYSITGGSAGGSSGATPSYSGSVFESTQQLVATVTPSATAGGSVNPASPQHIDTGSTASFTITPDVGQQILAVEGSCGGTLDGSTFTTSAIAADCTVQARFVDATMFVVTPSAGPGGSISPPSAQGVEPGQALELTLIPDAGYAIAGVGGTCGGVLNGQTYTTAPITANCTVEAGFSTVAVTVSASASGGHGTIGPQTQTLDYGSVATLTVSPEFGYNALVSGCGGTLSGNTYTTAALTADCAVTASFAPFSTAGTSLQLKMAPSGQDPCATGASTVEIAAGEQVALCLTLSNQTGRLLRSMTITRNAMPGDFNAYLPEPLATGGIQAGLTYDSPLGAVSPLESTDVNIVWSALDESPIPGYSYDDAAPFEAVDISTSPTAIDLGLARPRTNVPVHMPFTFNYFGIPASVLCVSNDGAIIVALEVCDTWGGDSWLQIAPALRAYPDYVSGYGGGTVYTDVLGAAPNRRFVVQWHDKQIVGYGSNGVTFQALIDEATSAITFQYVAMTVGDSSVDNGQGAASALVLGNGAAPAVVYYGALANGKAIRWTPGAQPFTALATASGHIVVRSPTIDVKPQSIAAQASSEGMTTMALTLGNLGNAPLQWQAVASGDGRGFDIREAYNAPLVQTMATAPATRAAPSATTPPAQTTGSVPAYAHAWGGTDNSRFVSFDAVSPASLTNSSGSVNIWAVHAGGFVNGDFSQLYLLQSPGESFDAVWEGSLQKFDPEANQSQRTVLEGIGTVPQGSVSWRGLRWDLRTNTLFGVATNWVDQFSPPPFQTSLYRIDPATGWTTRIARLDDVSSIGTVLADIAIDNDGNVYGIDMVTDTLVAIDKVTGHLRQIGPTGLNVGLYNLQSMDFDHSTGILYYATWTSDSTVGAQMFTVDTATGAATLVGTIGDGHSGLRALSIAKPGGPCVNANEVPWLSLDHGSGSVAAADSDTVEVTLNASGLAPGTYRANLCIGSNTPYKSQVTVPVSFTVGASDSIFADGFDAR